MDRNSASAEASAAIIERIRKLLALAADNPNEGERETALGIAQRLMLEHGLGVQDVEGDRVRPAGDGYVEQDAGESHAITVIHRIAAGITARYFFVRCVVIRRADPQHGARWIMRFFGRPENVAVGVYVYTFLLREISERRKAWRKLVGSAKLLGSKIGEPVHARQYDERAFLMGLEMGISERLRAVESRSQSPRPGGPPQSQAIAIRENLRTAFEQRYPNLREIPQRKAPEADELQWNDLLSGVTEGRKINIRNPLGEASGADAPAVTATRRREGPR